MPDPTIKVLPGDLAGTSPQFTGKATSVSDLTTYLTTVSNSLIGTLGVMAALQQLAQAMENYRTRLATSMQCFSTALKDTGHGLLETADLFVSTDSTLAGTFTTLDSEGQYQGYDAQTDPLSGSGLQGLLNGDTGTLTDPLLPSSGQDGSLPSWLQEQGGLLSSNGGLNPLIPSLTTP